MENTMKVALSCSIFDPSSRYSGARVIEIAKECGYQGVEFWWKYYLEKPESLRALAVANGLGIILHGPSGPVRIISPDPDVEREHREQYRKCLEDAGKMGASLVVLHPGRLSNSHGNTEKEFAIKDMIKFGKQLAEQAEKIGIRIGLEIMAIGGGEDYLTNLTDGAKIVEGVAYPETFGLTLDISHVLFPKKGELQSLENILPYKDKIFHVHLSGPDHLSLNSSKAEIFLALRQTINQLRQIAYAGFVAIEGKPLKLEEQIKRYAHHEMQGFYRLLNEDNRGTPA